MDFKDKVGLNGLLNCKIYEIGDNGNKLIDEFKQSNIIVNYGINYLLQNIVPSVSFSSFSYPNQVGNVLAFVGFGNGAIDPTNPFNIVQPQKTDTNLYSQITVNPTNPLYADNGLYVPITITATSPTVLSISFSLQSLDCLNEVINEIGLFTATSTNPSVASNFTLFSHLTFSSRTKTNNSIYIFDYSIYG